MNQRDPTETPSDQERGTTSRAGYSEMEAPRSPQDTSRGPKLAEPAKEEPDPPTHPKRDDGVGPVDEGESRGEAPVPKGDPRTESDRTDSQ